MANTNVKNNDSATIVTGRRTRLSYANLFEPRGFDGKDPQYSVSLIISKDDKYTLNLIRNAIKVAYDNGAHTLRGNGRVTPSMNEINLPLNDGDKKRPNDPAYANAYYINAKNKQKPKLYDVDDTECLDRSVIYSGCYAKCKVSFYTYNQKGNKGIACSLHGVQKVADGEPLGGNVTTVDDFKTNDDYEDDADFLN